MYVYVFFLSISRNDFLRRKEMHTGILPRLKIQKDLVR